MQKKEKLSDEMLEKVSAGESGSGGSKWEVHLNDTMILPGTSAGGDDIHVCGMIREDNYISVNLGLNGTSEVIPLVREHPDLLVNSGPALQKKPDKHPVLPLIHGN